MIETTLTAFPTRATAIPRRGISGWIWLPRLAAGILAATWFWSASSKWGVPRAVELFGVIRDVFPWIPARLAERFALELPFAELALGGGLLLPWTRRWAAAASMLLLAGFTLFLIKAWIMGNQHSCGCFGDVSHLSAAHARLSYGLSVLRNGGLMILAALASRPRHPPPGKRIDALA